MTFVAEQPARAIIGKRAVLYRMVMHKHLCPYGLKARDLLRRQGYEVEDHWLRTREDTEAFKAQHGVRTTPQVFIGSERVGGYDDLRRLLGKRVADPNTPTYRPVGAVFAVTALMALAASYAAFHTVLTVQAGEWFVAFSMCALAMLKLQDVERFSTTRSWPPYAYVYPCAELGVGVLMAAGALRWVAAPVALLIGAVGAVSVVKAVYIDRRELKCACVGGANNVPLGFLSLTENLMMVAMAVWMLTRAV